MVGVHYEEPKALDRLKAVFPCIEKELAGKSVVDFGCGYGYQLIALVNAGAAEVVGIEVDEKSFIEASSRVKNAGLSDRIRMERVLFPDLKADAIISQNSFEHFLEPEKILGELKRSLAPEGRIYITFAPPWYAPWGAHTAFFCRVPWVHIAFPERAVMEARSVFRPDGAKTYAGAGLAKMSVAKFERVVGSSGLKVVSSRYDCVRGISILKHLPGLRELFINRVSVILTNS